MRYNFLILYDIDKHFTFITNQKENISEVLVVAGLAPFAYWRYKKMTEAEKDKIHADLKMIGEKVVRELIPEGIKTLLPSILKQ